MPGPLIIAVVRFEEESAIATVGEELHDEKVYPGLAEAEICRPEVPLSYHMSKFGLVVPAPIGLVLRESRYWGIQVQVMAEGLLIVKLVLVVVPELETLPVPIQPVQRYLVFPDSSAGLDIEAVTRLPVGNQPLAGEGRPWSEVTAKLY